MNGGYATFKINELESTIEQLRAENKRLRDALKKHKHTDKCFAYAAKTARQSGNYYCIAECADSHTQALQEKP